MVPVTLPHYGQVVVGNLFSKTDFACLRDIVSIDIKKKVGNPIGDLTLYHESVSDEEHSAYFGDKRSRILCTDDSTKVLSSLSIASFINLLGNYKITDVKFGDGTFDERPEVYYRVVRPSRAHDVGVCHIDHWFDQAQGLDYGELRAYKTWTLLFGDFVDPGIEFYLPDPAFSSGFTITSTPDGSKKFVPHHNLPSSPKVNAPLSVGQSYIFDHQTIHRGVSSTRSTRISVEIDFCPLGFR
jgi:hypothetical protein